MKEFQNKIVVVTGGARGIGRCITEEFRKAGASVCTFDLDGECDFAGDLARVEDLERFADMVIRRYGHIDYLVNNAPPLFKGIDECGYEEFCYAQKVGVVAPFYLSKLFKDHFTPGGCIINMSSSRDRMSQPQSESYSAAKGGIAALTHSMAVSLAGKVRVNSISPGWIDTTDATFEGADNTQHPAGRVGKPIDIASMVLFLCSAKAASSPARTSVSTAA